MPRACCTDRQCSARLQPVLAVPRHLDVRKGRFDATECRVASPGLYVQIGTGTQVEASATQGDAVMFPPPAKWV
jgi:hypothetical protein